VWVLACLVGGLGLHGARAQEAKHSGDSNDVPREIVLRPEVVAYDLESNHRSIEKVNRPFRKEPAVSARFLFRGMLRLGKDTNNAFGLIWDSPKRQLYVDLNRNLDLTDDPAGVFSSTNKGFQQSFYGVAMTLKTEAGALPVVAQLDLSVDADGKSPQVRLASRSLWQARQVIHGKEWQVAAVDELFGSERPGAARFLVLRPWEMRTNQVYVRYAASGIFPFPERLFWQGRAFRMERRLENDGGAPVCRLEFAPQQTPLTELRLSGKSLAYAVLEATNGYTVVLDEPGAGVKIPPGVYDLRAAWLRQGAAAAFWTGYPPLVVRATTATNLVLGGPLTNWVTLARSGRKLIMSYRLQGANDESYRLAREDRGKPPEFTVYRGGKRVFGDRFEFG
jgi:hypothetical protein